MHSVHLSSPKSCMRDACNFTIPTACWGHGHAGALQILCSNMTIVNALFVSPDSLAVVFLSQRSLRAAECWTLAAALAETVSPSVNWLERADMWRGLTWQRSWWLEKLVHTVWILDFCTVFRFNLLLFRSQCLASMSSTIRRSLATRKPTCLLSRGTWRSSMRLEYRTTQLMLCCRFGKQTLFYISDLYFIIYTCGMDLWSDHKPNPRHLSWNGSSL